MPVLLADTNCILIITEFTSTYCSMKSGIVYEMCIEKKHENKSCPVHHGFGHLPLLKNKFISP